MTKRREVDNILTKYTGRTGADLDIVKQELSEVGVVIKVERELPKGRHTYAFSENCLTIHPVSLNQVQYGQLDFYPVEPLIEK